MQNRLNADAPDIRARVAVEIDPVTTSLEKWAKPGHFCRVLSKGPETTTWIWNIHADVHDFDCQIDSLQEISRKIFSAHFGQLAIIFLWLGGMYFHGARFSNYAEWLKCPDIIQPTAHQVWSIVGQEVLNAELGGSVSGIQITSGLFYLWRACGITDIGKLYCTATASLFMSGLLIYAGWFHYHKAAPELEWFNNAESMLNHHLAGLLGLGSLSWSGHQIHISLPITKLLDSGASLEEIPAPYEFLINQNLIEPLYPSFKKGLIPFFTLNWGEYRDFLTFKGGLNPITGSLWITDTAHHHLALSVLLIFAGHMYRTNWGIGHTIKKLLDGHHGPISGAGHVGLYEILTMSWHAQLAINLATLGSLTIVVAHHMYSMPPYPFLGVDYSTQLSLFTHHMWIGGFCISGAGAHASIFMVRDYNPIYAYNNLVDHILRYRDIIISFLNWVCIFLGLHSFGVYIHNDTMRALGRSQDMFSDKAISLQPIFAKWVQFLNFHAPGSTAPNTLATSSYVFGGDIISVNGRIIMLPIQLGTADFMVHHIHAFTIHVTVLVLLKGTLFARNSRLIPDKTNLGFRFPCDGPGRGGTCQVSAWDHIFLGLFWVYNCISIAIFHFSWKLQSDVWGVVSNTGKISHITARNFATSSLTINGWLRDFLWAQSSQVIQTYSSELSSYGLIFLGAHFIWAFSLMFLFSGRGYWQELIESITWAHAKLKLKISVTPRALSITQGRAIGLAHYLLGGIGATWSFFLARVVSLG